MAKHMVGLNYQLKFEEVKDIHPSFAMARVGIAYPGRNRNRSSISKEAFEASLPGIKNIPIVGRYIPDQEDFGSHDIRVVASEDGGVKIENATVPFGVVHESAKQYWEDVREDDGTVREYLFTDCILWKRQPGYEVLAKQGTWNQSMEISFDSYILDSEGYCVIDDFRWEALCILGNSVEPCFESACVQLADEGRFQYHQQFALMVEELSEAINQSQIDLSFDNDNTAKKGGNAMNHEAVLALLAEFGLEESVLEGMEYSEMTEEELRQVFEEKANANLDTSASQNGDGGEQQAEISVFAVTYMQIWEALSEVLSPVVERDEDGNRVREVCNWVRDFDDNYVYVERYIRTDDNSQSDHGRYSYTYDSNTRAATITGEFEEMVMVWMTVAESQAREQEQTNLQAELEELRSFRQETENNQHQADVEAMFAEFEDLAGIEEFVTLRTNAEADFSAVNLEDLELRLFAIRGKNAKVEKPKAHVETTQVPLPEAKKPESDEPMYASLFAWCKED